nr:reverse transcriptase [Tanacetum cinerariifolium]
MAHAIGTIASTSNNEDGGVNERLRSMEKTLAQITRAMQEMVTMNQGLNGNGRNQNQNQFTRMKKVEFPKFSRDDVKRWIFRCEQFFSIDEIPENQKSSSKEYQVAFDTLLSRVDVSEEHAVSFYLGGLPTEIETWVRLFRRKTLVDTYQLINLQEATLEAIKKKNKALLSSQNRRFGSGSNSFESNAKSSRLPLPAPNSSWRTKPNTPTRGYEMVLGIQWLATLGDIKCNFSQLRMEFMYKNKRMTLRGLPKSQGKNLTFVVVDRLSKYAYFIALSHPFPAHQVAQAFLDNVYKLHGMPESIVSNREKMLLLPSSLIICDCICICKHKRVLNAKPRIISPTLPENQTPNLTSAIKTPITRLLSNDVKIGLGFADNVHPYFLTKPIIDVSSLADCVLVYGASSTSKAGLDVFVSGKLFPGNPPSFGHLLQVREWDVHPQSHLQANLTQIAPLKGLPADFDGSLSSIGNRMLQNGPDSDAFQRYYNICVLNVTPTLKGPLFDVQRSLSGHAKSVAQSVFLNMIFLSRC